MSAASAIINVIITVRNAEPRGFVRTRLRAIGRVLKRRARLIVGTVLILNLVAVALIHQLTPRYTAEASLIIDPRQPNVLDLNTVMSKLSGDREALESEIQLRPRVVYTRARVQNAVNRILELYRRNGRYAAKVEPKIIELDQNRVDLVFEIDEGPITGIGGITFIGNKKFSDSTLRGVIQTRETAWYRLFTSDDTYDPDRVAFDQELLRRFYAARGYVDFQVVSAVAEFYLAFQVHGGWRIAGAVCRIRRMLFSGLLWKHLATKEKSYNC